MDYPAYLLLLIFLCFVIPQSSQEYLNQTELNEFTSTNNEESNTVKESIVILKSDNEDNCKNCRRTTKSTPFAKLLTARYIVPAITFYIVIAQDEYKLTKFTDLPQNICGTYAKCFDDDDDPKVQELGGPYCKCDADTYGNPPNCTFYCLETCKSNEYYETAEKLCKSGCSSDGTCMSDEYCCMLTRDCRKGCRSDESCGQEEFCSDESLEFPKNCIEGCRSHDFCESEEFCDQLDKECKVGCYSDDGCKENEFCSLISNSCKIGCRSHEYCKTDEYCYGYGSDDGENLRICRKGCRFDDSCNSDEYCDPESKECRKGCRPDSCKEKEICDLESHECKNGCWKDSECEFDEFCSPIESKCVKSCSNSYCGDNSLCTGLDHKQYCSCTEGTNPIKGIGCTKGNSPDWKECEAACGESSSCEIKDNNVYCFCAHDFDKNPFIECTPDTHAEKFSKIVTLFQTLFYTKSWTNFMNDP